jgi:hypothetical protein
MIMKKIIICLAALMALTLGFTSCEKDSEGLTRITYYAQIVLEGDEYMIMAKGTDYVEPGYSATMKGEDVTKQVKVVSNVDPTTSGVYSVVYSIENADGFLATATRTVVVLNLSDPIEGFWQVDVANSNRIYDGGAPAAYKGAFEFLIINEGDSYYVEDLMAGWYAQGAGYGAAYEMNAHVSIDKSGAITLLDSEVPGWGDAADDFQNGKYDAAAKTISYSLYYGGVIIFNVSLNKVEL